jgi:hypothetical protein
MNIPILHIFGEDMGRAKRIGFYEFDVQKDQEVFGNYRYTASCKIQLPNGKEAKESATLVSLKTQTNFEAEYEAAIENLQAEVRKKYPK